MDACFGRTNVRIQLCAELHAVLKQLGHMSVEGCTGVRVAAVKDDDEDEWIGVRVLDDLPSGSRMNTRARTCSCT